MPIETPDSEATDAIVDLWVGLAEGQREYGSHLLPEGNRQTVRESVVRHLVADGVRVAREDGDVVGVVMFDEELGTYEQDVDRGVVENLYVVPDYRGQGIGTDLLHAAEDALAEAGVDVISLEVMAANERARRFYRRHGYAAHRVEMEAGTDTHSKDDH